MTNYRNLLAGLHIVCSERFRNIMVMDSLNTISRLVLERFLLFVWVTSIATASEGGGERSMSSSSTRLRFGVGAHAAAMRVIQIGAFSTTCGCSYSEGSGLGSSIGFLGDVAVNGNWKADIGVGWRSYSTSSAVRESRLEYDIDMGEYINADFERTAEADASYLWLDAHASWFPSGSGLHIFAGPALGVLMDCGMWEEEEILSADLVYGREGEKRRVVFDGDPDALYSVRRIRADVELGAGFEFNVGPTSRMSARLSGTWPLLGMVDEYPSWAFASLKFSLALMIDV